MYIYIYIYVYISVRANTRVSVVVFVNNKHVNGKYMQNMEMLNDTIVLIN